MKKEIKRINHQIKFWKDWLKADKTKRLKLIKDLPITRIYLKKEPEELSEYTFVGLLNSYFEDLESQIYSKLAKKNLHK
ncbi:MAG: hypothetical protein HY831_05475 [Candidatus Aenigmarchaeota archaeon]|nr:hypothetical protein [Candidatus Aenigmarchaeota archaeon]